MTFGENLKRIRKSRGMSQSELAKRVGAILPTSSNSISRYEKNEASPDTFKIEAIASALGCNVGDLFGEEPKKGIEIIVRMDGKEVMRWASQ